MGKLYDEEGNEVENVFTQEEVDARMTELTEKAKMTDEEKAELEKLRNKDMNFANLRKQLAKRNGAKEEETDEDDDKNKGGGNDDKNKKDEKKEEKKPATLPTEATELLDDEGLDEDQRAKAEFYFKRLAGAETDPTLVRVFMKDAIRLASGNDGAGDSSFRGGVGARGGRQGGGANGGKKKTSEAGQAIGAALQVNDADREKYGKADWKPEWQHVKNHKTQEK